MANESASLYLRLAGFLTTKDASLRARIEGINSDTPHNR